VFLALALALQPDAVVHAAQPEQLVLFVGNSLTYVGNTPAVFDSLSTANGKPVASDMIVKGGATLTERLRDGSVARALASKRYSVIVLQERGGDLVCSFGPASCAESRAAMKSLAALAAETGAKAYLLGSYQADPEASDAIVAAESAAATEAGIPYIEVSQKLRSLRAAFPSFEWMAADGMHPGPGLALLNAAAVFQALTGSPPAASALEVTAPIYGTASGLTESLRAAEAPPPRPATPTSITYQQEWVRLVARVLAPRAGS
jgi:hypothetical protein